MRTSPMLLAALAATLTATLAAGAAHARPRQLTASSGDTYVARRAPNGRGPLALVSDGDLTPGAPGNADGSRETFTLDVRTGALRQLSASDRSTTPARVGAAGDVVLVGTGDLTPGAPGNADRSVETWFFDAAEGRLEQATATASDTFFQAYFDGGRRAFFVSKGDLTPGAPGNADGRNEVFTLARDTGEFRQLTNTPQESLVRALDPLGRFALVQSRGDLTPGAPGNADASCELYLLDLATLALHQVTASTGDSVFADWSADGRHVAFTSTGDLTGDNADGSREVFVLELPGEELRQLTASAADSDFASFGPRAHLVGIHARGDLVAGGDGDGSQEVFLADLRDGSLAQLTRSAGDSTLVGIAPRRRFAAIVSRGDLAPGAPGNADGSEELYLVRLRGRERRVVQATDGDAAVLFAGFDRAGRYAALSTRGDPVPSLNADGSSEAFAVRVRSRPRVLQLTESDADTFAGPFLRSGRRLLLESRADLARTGPGNADGSLEVFVAPVRRVRRPKVLDLFTR